jgi:hypothetical protein
LSMIPCQGKIEKMKELISEEQKMMDENVNEYLKLYQSADDRQQQERMETDYMRRSNRARSYEKRRMGRNKTAQ